MRYFTWSFFLVFSFTHIKVRLCLMKYVETNFVWNLQEATTIFKKPLPKIYYSPLSGYNIVTKMCGTRDWYVPQSSLIDWMTEFQITTSMGDQRLVATVTAALWNCSKHLLVAGARGTCWFCTQQWAENIETIARETMI